MKSTAARADPIGDLLYVVLVSDAREKRLLFAILAWRYNARILALAG